MEIADARVASIHYTLTDDDGKVIDKSPESQPLAYFHGAGNIVPGLEKALAGKQVGDSLKVDVKPGTYRVHVDGESIRAATIKVGRARNSAQNDLLQP